jgi:short-subunit dehydrogenase
VGNRFTDKTVIVTGASSGIGVEAARQFAAEGARVVLAARRKEPLDAAARSIGSDRTLVVPTDVTDPGAAAALLKQAEAHFGSIDVLVNNAGVHARGGIEGREVEELVHMVDVNLRAPVALCRMAVPYLRRSGGGAIVNVGSIAGRIPVAGVATYGATKAGLRTFSLALAEELRGSGITVSVVSPGPVDTKLFTDQIDRVPAAVMCQSMSSPAAVARLILDCACDGRLERVIPRLGAVMPTIACVFPRLNRAMHPLLTRMGRRRKEGYLRTRRLQGEYPG